MNKQPVWISFDANPDTNCGDLMDRVRGFYSLHPTGSNFSRADSSTTFIPKTIDPVVYRAISTKNGTEIVATDF